MPKNTGRGSKIAGQSPDHGKFLVAKSSGGKFRSENSGHESGPTKIRSGLWAEAISGPLLGALFWLLAVLALVLTPAFTLDDTVLPLSLLAVWTVIMIGFEYFKLRRTQ